MVAGLSSPPDCVKQPLGFPVSCTNANAFPFLAAYALHSSIFTDISAGRCFSKHPTLSLQGNIDDGWSFQ